MIFKVIDNVRVIADLIVLINGISVISVVIRIMDVAGIINRFGADQSW